MKVLLTGSSKGIGYNIAKDLIKEGHQLALHYNSNKSLLEVLINEYSSNSFIVKADLSVENEIKNLVDDTIENLSFPDCIINNAGIAESADIKLDLNNWGKMFDKTIDINLKAPSLIFKEFLNIKERKKLNLD
jgi:NAD(P)-dependent dehydrogenase (short-subunit alcohol dehydrogenase family)